MEERGFDGGCRFRKPPTPRQARAKGSESLTSCPSFAIAFAVPPGGVPDADLPAAAVAAGGGQAFAVGTERDVADPAGVSADGVQLGAGLAVPEFDGVVGARRRQVLAV